MATDVEVVRDWAEDVRTKMDRLIKQEVFAQDADQTLEANLRRETLIGFARLQSAAMDAGHPDFILRVLNATARVSGLTSGDLNIGISMGGAESLPDLSHMSDEEIMALSGTPVIPDASKPLVALDTTKKRGRPKKNVSDV